MTCSDRTQVCLKMVQFLNRYELPVMITLGVTLHITKPEIGGST